MNANPSGEAVARVADPATGGTLSVVDERSAVPAVARRTELMVPAMSPLPVAQAATSVDPKAVMASVRRRWFLALSLGLFAGGLASAIAWFAIPETYVAFAELHVLSTPQKVLWDMSDRGMQFLTYRQSQMRQLTGPFVLQAAIREPDIANLSILKDEEHPLEWLEGNLNVSAPATEFIRVSLRGRQPADVAMLVNAVTNSYLKEVADVESGVRAKRKTELERARDDMVGKRKQKSMKLRRLAEEVGAASEQSLSASELALVEFYAMLRTRLANAEFERSRTEFQLKGLKGLQADGAEPVDIPSEVLDSHVDQEPAVQGARLAADAAEKALVREKSVRKAGHPSLVRLEEAHQRAQNDVEIARSKARADVTKRLRNEFVKKSESTVTSLEAQLKHNIDEIADLKLKLKDQVQARKTTAIHSLELASLQKELTQDELIEHQITQELTKIDVEGEMGPRVTLFRKAEIPHSPDMTKKIRIVGLSGGGGLAVIVLGIIWLDLRTKRINSLEEVSGGLRLPVLGLLPTVPRRIAASHDPNTSGAQGVWQGTLMESVDAARVMLLRRAQLDKAKVAMVVSAVASEGKTTLACHLATSLARSGHKTLLVDADMRRPTVHRVFELPNEPGLCELLRRECSLADVVIPTAQDGLYLVPAGQLTHDALRELAQDGMGPIIKQMREEYDFVIFDSSPILPVTDSLMLGKHIDGSIISIRRDVSQHPKVASACQRLAAMGVPVWGAVVIGLGQTAYGYRYAYTYGAPVRK